MYKLKKKDKQLVFGFIILLVLLFGVSVFVNTNFIDTNIVPQKTFVPFGTPIASYMNGGVIRTSVGLNTYIDSNGLSPLEKFLMEDKN